MKIKLTDIPPEGREIDFCLETRRLNERANSVRDSDDSSTVQPPQYLFEGSPSVSLRLMIQNATVEVRGAATSTVRTPCSFCAEDVVETLDVDILVILKPLSVHAKKEKSVDEDIGFGFYEGKEIDCAIVVEEQFILNLPYRVSCPEEKKAACEEMQQQVSEKLVGPPSEEAQGDERFAIFRSLKVDSE